MSDELKKESPEMAATDGVELSDEMLDAIAGGFVYHDPGDPKAHRREAFYVLDDEGNIIMKRTGLDDAEHWAENLRTSTRVLTTDEFEALRRGH